MTLEEQDKLARAWVSDVKYVRTKKGAAFEGHVRGMYYNPEMDHYGVVVVADSLPFSGTTHVYPITQLEEVE